MTNDVLIFDMDGTLYYSDSFIENYIGFLSEDEVMRKEMMVYYRKVTEEFSKPEYANFTYRGEPLGDFWQILFHIADKYGISEQDNHQAFLRTREQMIGNREISVNEALINTIKSIPTPKILMTNSPEISATTFIDYLGLSDAFDMYIYDARKPFGMNQHIELIREKYPEQNIIKIGDNIHNDIQSSNDIGIGSIYINHFNSKMLNEVTLYSLEQLEDYLKLKYTEV